MAVRNIRRDGNVAFKKLKGTEVSEDEIKDLEDDLQKITDKYIEKIDKMVEVKTKRDYDCVIGFLTPLQKTGGFDCKPSYREEEKMNVPQSI